MSAPQTPMNAAAPTWIPVCALSDIPRLGSRVVHGAPGIPGPAIALFRTADDGVYALHDRCPHKGGPLSQGIVAGNRVVCPLHAWNIELPTGQAVAPDVGGCRVFQVKVTDGQVFLALNA